MGDDNTVRRLVEILSSFYIDKSPVKEDLTCSLTKEFLQNIQIVLLAKQSVIAHRWKHFLHVCGYKMLSSSEMYLRYVIHACKVECKFNFNIFETFLGVFSLVIHLNTETLKITKVNFCQLIPDIFMAFYSSELKILFCKRGGFNQFTKYINNPHYISLKSSNKGLFSIYYHISNVDVSPNELAPQMGRVSHEKTDLLKNFTFESEKDCFSETLAHNILNSIKMGFLLLPSTAELKIKKMKLPNADAVLESSLNSDSDISDDTVQIPDKEQCERIIQTVIRHNQSKSSDHEETYNPLQKEAHGILEHLKDKIKSLIEVLDEYGKK